MGATRWFAAICASLAAAPAAAADGVDLSLRSRALPLKVEAVEVSAHTAAPLTPAISLDTSVHSERERVAGRPACGVLDMCYESGDRQLFYRGARRYMPSVDGLAAEGVSLHHDRLILKYSFR